MGKLLLGDEMKVSEACLECQFRISLDTALEVVHAIRILRIVRVLERCHTFPEWDSNSVQIAPG